jgi:iron complex outermembrane receptor protein
MSISRAAALAAIAGLSAGPTLVRAQTPGDQQLPPVTVTAPAPGPQVAPVSPQIDRYAPPQTIESTDQRRIEDTTNIIDSGDVTKYMPSLLLRKRNHGDTQPTLATRTWGVNSSARTLVYVDDIPISALISNNNTNGAPRWGLVSPEEIKGADFLYGPFSAAWPGNSVGGVLLITTRMPDKLEATLKQTEALQTFGYYNTYGSYLTSNSAGTIGDKVGRLSFFLAVNREESFSQPLAFVTNGGAFAAGTNGTIPALTKTGTVANVVGAGGLLHSIMDNYKLKLAVDLTDWLKASYTIGYWDNTTFSTVQSYLTAANGTPTFGGVSGFANNTYNLGEQHLMHALSLKTDTGGNWDWELIATRYDYLQSLQRSPAGVTTGTNFTTNGLIARMDGTGWMTQDIKAVWRPTGLEGPHELSAGLHHDQYRLENPTWNAPSWLTSPDNGNNTVSTYGRGRTETWALWLQEAWSFAPGWKLTVGGRGETWRAYDGFNVAGSIAAAQPELGSTNFSPKASLWWQIDDAWSAKASFGQAYRYPTVAELYQVVSTGPTFAIPNPNLLPESALSFEFTVERQDKNSRVRVSLFEEDTANALIQQTQLINNVFTNTWQNVGLIRNRGVELVGELKDFIVAGLSLSNSLTYVDSKIISNPGFQSATGTISQGMWAPYVPQWRDTAQAVYRPNETLSFAASARYQGKMYSTLDNSDYVQGVQGSFDPFFVLDAHVRYQMGKAVSAEFGVDNLTDSKYFLFHPFPGRTFIAGLKIKL